MIITSTSGHRDGHMPRFRENINVRTEIHHSVPRRDPSSKKCWNDKLLRGFSSNIST